MQLSVIICTHNPREDYLRRVLDALKVQTLSKEQWELLLIDNVSKEPLAKGWDLTWHSHARHIREDELGLTPARLRGIKESVGEILVFVDDDNVLASDYLSETVSTFLNWPKLGAIGGSIKGEFEIPPPDWIIPYLERLAICELDQDHWSNTGEWSRSSPYGAGLCVCRKVAEDYAQKFVNCELRKLLGRSGTAMGACEDNDLAWCAVDLGMGTGRFAGLEVLHLIAKSRLTREYIIRLNAGIAASAEVLRFIRNRQTFSSKKTWREWARLLVNCLQTKGVHRQIVIAEWQARRAARRLLVQSVKTDGKPDGGLSI